MEEVFAILPEILKVNNSPKPVSNDNSGTAGLFLQHNIIASGFGPSIKQSLHELCRNLTSEMSSAHLASPSFNLFNYHDISLVTLFNRRSIAKKGLIPRCFASK